MLRTALTTWRPGAHGPKVGLREQKRKCPLPASYVLSKAGCHEERATPGLKSEDALCRPAVMGRGTQTSGDGSLMCS